MRPGARCRRFHPSILKGLLCGSTALFAPGEASGFSDKSNQW
jgi:hypothetical protein